MVGRGALELCDRWWEMCGVGGFVRSEGQGPRARRKLHGGFNRGRSSGIMWEGERNIQWRERSVGKRTRAAT